MDGYNNKGIEMGLSLNNPFFGIPGLMAEKPARYDYTWKFYDAKGRERSIEVLPGKMHEVKATLVGLLDDPDMKYPLFMRETLVNAVHIIT